jgi:hypothetical protein
MLDMLLRPTALVCFRLLDVSSDPYTTMLYAATGHGLPDAPAP